MWKEDSQVHENLKEQKLEEIIRKNFQIMFVYVFVIISWCPHLISILFSNCISIHNEIESF